MIPGVMSVLSVGSSTDPESVAFRVRADVSISCGANCRLAGFSVEAAALDFGEVGSSGQAFRRLLFAEVSTGCGRNLDLGFAVVSSALRLLRAIVSTG